MIRLSLASWLLPLAALLAGCAGPSRHDPPLAGLSASPATARPAAPCYSLGRGSRIITDTEVGGAEINSIWPARTKPSAGRVVELTEPMLLIGP